MKIAFKHITLVYSRPKYVTVTLDCECGCGLHISTNSLSCHKYGRIHVQCRSCGTKETTIILNRENVKDFHLKGFPHLAGSLDTFLDSWESDMGKS